MSRLLPSPGLAAEPRTVGLADPALDAAVRAAVERAAEESYSRGCRDGAAEAAAATERAAQQIVAALRRSAAELRAMAARADVALAAEIARAVLEREPADGSMALLQRVESALAELDDDAIAVRVHPGDAPTLAAAVERTSSGSGTAVQVLADPGIAPGEAMLAGRWARADLTRTGALDVLGRLLSAEAAGEERRDG